MAYVPVPKDLNRVKTKVMFNLTKRQLICFALAAAVGVPVYFLTKPGLGITAAAMLMVVIMLPFIFFALYEKDGQPAEKILSHVIKSMFLRDKVRVYRTNNIYAVIQQEIKEKEELKIEQQNGKGKSQA
ncbi:MAG: PrgI family protein [Ruminococcus sp.]|nr:PrgI family protein [Ruminococcus sp.]